MMKLKEVTNYAGYPINHERWFMGPPKVGDLALWGNSVFIERMPDYIAPGLPHIPPARRRARYHPAVITAIRKIEFTARPDWPPVRLHILDEEEYNNGSYELNMPEFVLQDGEWRLYSRTWLDIAGDYEYDPTITFID